VDVDELAERLSVQEARRPLLRCLLTILDDAGVLTTGQRGRETTGRWPDGAALEPLEQFVRRYPDAEREARMFHRCGTALAAVLTGRQDPLSLLFPPDASLTAADLYADTLLSDTVNGIVERVVIGIANVQPAGRTLRVLEVGAGTGGVTAAIAPRLPADRTAYLFTDVSSGFLVRARERFADLPYLETARLDIERDPIAQGFEAAAFDIVVAANVLHATRDLRESVTHAARLLAPGGVLVLLEGTAPRRAIDLIFGMTDGWWRFQDHDLRPSHPLVDPGIWRRVLEQSGFEQVDSFGSAPGDSGILASQAVLVARREGVGAVVTHDERQAAVPGLSHASLGRWVVLGDRGDTGSQVADRLRAAGAEVSLVSNRDDDGPGDWFTRGSSDTQVSGVVDVRPLDLPAASTLTGDRAQHSAERVCGELAGLVRALVPVASRRCALHLVTRGAMALEGEPLDGMAQAGVWGIGRVITLEHPELRTCLHDLDPRDRTSDASKRLVEGMLRRDAETLQLIRSGEHRVARLEPYPVSGFPEFACDPDGTYLVTGGLGGLGLLLADWLASKGAGRIVLAGRRPPSPPAREAIRAIEASGQQIVVSQTDVADRSAVDVLLGWIGENGPRLAGVFHAAGHLDDGILTQLDAQRSSAVLKPKVQGAWNLHLATRQYPLDCFVLFSAATSLIGSPGQASHAAANAFLDALAHHRRAQGLSAVSVNWGAWAQAGAVSGADVAARVRLKGLRLMAPDRGLAILERIISAGAVQVGVFDVDWARIPRALMSLPLLSRCAPSQRPPEEAIEVENPLLVPSARLRGSLAAFVREQVRQVLGMPARTVVDMEQGFFDLGMDSLTSMEFRSRLQTGLGCSLSSTEVFDYPTPSALVTHLHGLLASPLETARSTPDHRGDGAKTAAVTKPVDPEDDVADRLRRKLAELREELSR
jgi:SAM-dependent methyltransferase/NAD(P)-dependent dehydrogenase (short-subunit alcohol dehydrogenase family)/acyl carrier protein